MDTVLTFRDSKHTNVKQQVINLIPKMSEFAPEKFVLSYLEPCTDHLLSVLSSKTLPGGIAFQAFGQMIAPLAGPNSVKELQGRLLTRLPTIAHEVADALSYKNVRDPTKRNTCMEAITCVGVLAEVRPCRPSCLSQPPAADKGKRGCDAVHERAEVLLNETSADVCFAQRGCHSLRLSPLDACRRSECCGRPRCTACSRP